MERVDIINEHRRRWPLMQEQDIIKLLYQNEFGCEHLLSDKKSARERLFAEWESVRDGSELFVEDIGGGFVRVHLRGLSEPEKLWEAFSRTAEEYRGSMERFREKLGLLPQTEFLRGYIASGCPALHHSGIYRASYAPAYRVAAGEIVSKINF